MSNLSLVQYRPDIVPIQIAADALPVDWLQLVVAAGLTLGLTTIVALVIRKPLYAVLELICGREVSARFWTTFAAVLLVMGPLFLVFTAAGGAGNLADFVRRRPPSGRRPLAPVTGAPGIASVAVEQVQVVGQAVALNQPTAASSSDKVISARDLLASARFRAAL